MATQAIEQQAPDAAPDSGDGAESTEAPKRKLKLPLVPILALLGIAAGVGIGLFVTGPVLAKRRAAAVAKPVQAAGPTVVHAIENLVLNPAGSGGTRFLMVTATFELRDGGAEQTMKDHEAEVRDRILALLGKKTVDELSDISQRDGVKKELLAAVSPLFPKGAVIRVFFPQFVIQ
jgi:flagellar FliL protein